VSRIGTPFFFLYLCIAFGNKSVTFGNIKKPMSITRLGMLLGTAGYKPVRPKVAGRLVRGWLVYQRDTEEIATLKRLLKE
jgi:hypothetical protein